MKKLKVWLQIQKEDSKGKFILILSTLVMWLILGGLFLFYGYEETWRLWGVTSWSPFFFDFRLIPGMVETLHMGLDPAVENPGDPNYRIFNYPPIWYLLANTGLSQADTLWIGILLLVLFFCAVFLFPDRLQARDAVLLLLVLFSPAAMLLYERANVDLIIFFLCAMTLLAMDAHPGLASLLVLFASALKLFPIFGVLVFIREKRTEFFRLLAYCAASFFIYLAFIFGALRTSWALTERGWDISYGANVFVTRFAEPLTAGIGTWLASPVHVARILNYSPYLIALLIAMVFTWIGLVQTPLLTGRSARNLDAFRMGAAIYAGTFILGNNWDYRLVFLIFLIPQISEWIRLLAGGQRWVSVITMGLILFMCWYQFYNRHIYDRDYRALFIVDEVLNWSLFAGLAYLLGVSAPNWVKSIVKKTAKAS